eukprot:2849068-Prymnesium_polylepis.1
MPQLRQRHSADSPHNDRAAFHLRLRRRRWLRDQAKANAFTFPQGAYFHAKGRKAHLGGSWYALQGKGVRGFLPVHRCSLERLQRGPSSRSGRVDPLDSRDPASSRDQ